VTAKQVIDVPATLFGAETWEKMRGVDPAAFGSFLTEHAVHSCFEAIWARPGLDARSRSLVTMTLLTAANAGDQLRVHVNGAINLGVTPTEIEEMLYQCIPYLGYPLVSNAMRVAREALAARGLLAG